MELFEVTTTEHNGEQEYWGSHLVAARDIDQARKLARKYFKKWYEDGCEKSADPDDLDSFEFMGGRILLTIDDILETALEDWIDKQVGLHSIGRLPKTETTRSKCKELMAICEYIRDCLDVGGEQSRQFAEEIKTLREVIGHPKVAAGVLDEISKKRWIVQKLRRLAVEAEGLTVSLPTMPVKQWLDGTVADATVDADFEEHDLSAFLQFIADISISHGD